MSSKLLTQWGEKEGKGREKRQEIRNKHACLMRESSAYLLITSRQKKEDTVSKRENE